MIQKNFGKSLKQMRRVAGYTQQEISSQLNISRQAYSNYEQGRSIPSAEHLAQLSVLFNTNLFYLLFPFSTYRPMIKKLVDPLVVSEEELNRLVLLYLKMPVASRVLLLDQIQLQISKPQKEAL